MSKGEETRHAILAHAAHEAARLGLDGLSIGALARELHLSKSGLFAHFQSKEALQVAVLDTVAERFTDAVIRPSMRAPRGAPRLSALFEAWMAWLSDEAASDGCLFIAAAAELDDRPGPVRDRLVDWQRDWLEFIASVAAAAVKEGDLRPDLDTTQLAFELHGVVLTCHHAARLLGDPRAHDRARRAFVRLLEDARAPSPPKSWS